MRTGRPRKPLRARLEQMIAPGPDGCWLWTGKLSRDGYAHISAGGARGRRLLAHRASYELFVGPIPEGLTLDHLCRVRHCVNPAHLEPVTNAENILRGEGLGARNARKTRCKRGHEFTPGNTAFNRAGGRVCRTCSRAKTRAWQKANRPHRAAYARRRRSLGLPA